MAHMLEVLAEFDRRQVSDTWGCYSPQQWLGWKCGLGYVAASERLRVARALGELPVIRDGLSRGKLSFSKVRELTRVATPATDQCLAEIAECATAAQVAKIVRSLRHRTAKDVVAQVENRGFSWHSDDDGSIVFTIKLPTEVGTAVVARIDAAATPQKGVPAHQRRADVFAELLLADGDGDELVRPEVFIHIEPDLTAFDNGVAVAAEIAECAACDGPVTTVVDTADGPVVVRKDPAPTRAQRRWLKLRHDTCQVPGCDHDGIFDAHHVVERHLGGKTQLWNLVRLCKFHHRLVHVLGLRLTLHPDRRLEVTFPAGNPIDRTIEFAPFVAPPPPDPDWISSTWTGERLNLDYTLLAIQSRQQLAHVTA